MKWLPGILCVGLAALLLHFVPNTAVKKAAAPAVVLELFTSEGCSSCPAADRLLPRLADDSTIIPLSFHVDYWDRLGWKDRFSAAAYTERQRAYARQLKLESIYTPQLIINGQYELVGSKEASARNYIQQARKQMPTVEIRIDAVKRRGTDVQLICRLGGALDHTNLLAAVVQVSAETEVRGGENRGAKLTHTNVVRVFYSQPAKAEQQLSMALPKDVQGSPLKIVLYTQREPDGQISGARTIPIP